MTRQVQEAYIVAAARTAVGKAPRGMYRRTRPDDLLAHVLRQAAARVPALDLAAVDDVIVGCAIPEAEQGMNVARIALLLAGYPQSVAGVTVNRFCASGLQAVAMAADRIRLGEAEVMVAAGAETMSLIPMGGHHIAFNEAVFARGEHVGIAYGMGTTAETVAQRWRVSREAQDGFALESHRKALAAIAAGEFRDEIAPYAIEERRPDLASQSVAVRARLADTDEGPRADASAEGLAKLKPVFAAQGSVTAGNSSQTS
ncbi:MAG: beta-ketoacyl synthase N-terminal-like domain-containing protein, partial [Betaproteobacteria bacterium]